MQSTEQKIERAALAGLAAANMDERERSTDISLAELAALVETAGGQPVVTLLQNKPTPDPRTFLGEGKVAELRELIVANDCDLAVFDNELSPSQMRVLEEELGVRVLDRSGLILDIFAQRAQTREGQLQVELAQYQYLLPRLTGMWTHLVRQTASGGSSPIGTRGPGETQLETDRRHIRRKIQKLQAELEDVRKIRRTQRRRREKNALPVVALVGYTNAGKSTLLNAMAGFLKPSSGEIKIDGQTVEKPSMKYVTIFQNYGLLPWRSVQKNVELGLETKKLGREEKKKITDHYLEMVGLKEAAKKRPAQLSGGMQQRVAIARALAVEPEILFMDEPFGALDAITRMKLQKDVLKIAHETDKTVVFVTHDIEEAIFLADRIVIMSANPGKIKSIMKVTLPKDRDRTSDDFLLMRDKVYEIFQMKEERNIEYFI